MVDGGPLNAPAFLQERIIDRAIIIRSPITFRDPLGFGMSNEILEKDGLTKLGVVVV